MKQIFISYASEDLEQVSNINSMLLNRGMQTWMDKVNKQPGKWKPQIERAIRNSRYFFLFLSDIALQKMSQSKGFQGNEFEYAYELAMSISNAQFTIIPIRIEECDRGDHAIQSLTQYDLFGNSFNDELEKLISDIKDDSEIKSEEEIEISNLFNRSYIFFKQGLYDASIEIYKKIIKIDKYSSGFSSEATKMIGLNYSRLGFHEKAINYLERAINKGSDFSSSFYYLGKEYFHIKNYDKAIDSFRKALYSRDLQPWVEKNANKMINQIDLFLKQDKELRNDPYLDYFYAKPKEIKVGEPITLYWNVKKGEKVKIFSVFYKKPGLKKDIEYIDEWIVNKKGSRKVHPMIYNGADTKNWSYFQLQIDGGAYHKTINIKIKH